MKKLIFIIVLLSSVSIASAAKGPKFLGSWMSEKIISEGQSHNMFMAITFEADNDIINGELVFGIWDYEKNTKRIHITSFLVSEFTGDWEIMELSKERLILKMGDYQWHLFKYDEKKIAATNAKLKLSGLWKMVMKTDVGISETALEEDVEEEAVEEGAVEESAAEEEVVEEVSNENMEAYESEFEVELPTIYLRFDKNNMEFKLNEIYKDYTSSSSGSWMYKPKQKSILFIAGRRGVLAGNAELKKSDKNALIFENANSVYTFEKLEDVKVEELTFDYNYLNQHRKEESYPPWSNFEALMKQASTTGALVYDKGVYDKEIGIFKNSVAIYKPSVDDENERVIFTDYTIEGSDTIVGEEISIGSEYGSENEFFPQAVLSDYIILKKEQITVPAGTFECTVVIGFSDDGARFKYWMIDEKPAVFAKVISQRKNYRGKMEYIMLELNKIR
ncbi:MAG: hypothetical protein KAG64_01515 [Bacteroidales bacterium]|nr:hypothetical protein [Bacteroidales bacterium]